MDPLQSGEQPSADGNNIKSGVGGGGNNLQHYPSASAQLQRGDSVTNNNFHDCEADSGVDYGPPIELEEEEQHDNNADTINDTITTAAAFESKQQYNDGIEDLNPAHSNEEDTTTTITIEELEETVGLREATLESLHDKLSKLNDEIRQEEQTSSILQNDIELLNKKKIVLKKRTENNVQLVKELEGTLEKCLERLSRVLDADNDDANDDVDTKEEGKLDQLLQPVPDENGHAEVKEAEASNTIQNVMEAKKKDYADFEIIKMPIRIIEEDKGSITWPTFGSKDVKRARKEAASLPFTFPVWRTSELSSCALFTNLDSPELLLDMMNTTVLEHLLCREEKKVDGCGQVHVSKIWGTSLDVMTQVKWEHLLPSLQREIGETFAGGPCEERKLDPNIQLCPYELGGTCADDRCPYQHLSRPEPIQDDTKASAQDDDEVIKYHSLSKLTLPPREKATDADDVDLKPIHALEHSDEELDSSVEPTNQQCFEDNDDYVSLPTVTETTDGHDDQAVYNSNNSSDVEFSERFWWYSEHPFDTSLNDEEVTQDVFEKVVASFGFRSNGEFLEQISEPSSEDDKEAARLQKEMIVDARLIDLCRVCIHIGQGSFALTVLETFRSQCRSQRISFHKSLKYARQQVELSMSCSSSQNMFDSQIHLLVTSKCIHAKYLKPDLHGSTLRSSLDIISGKKKDGKYEDLFHSLVSRFPKRQKLSSAHSENKWAVFERSVHSLLKKHVIVPFSQLTRGDEFSFFLNCIHIGKVVENAVYELSEDHKTYSPLLHALEPTWASLQTMLQTSYALSTTSDWLQPDLVVTVIIGPIIYACVSKTIEFAVPSQGIQCQPTHDMRSIANLTCLDKCIVGILKDLNKSSQKNERGELIELLVTPLHALSVGISMEVGMVDKAQMKLGYALSTGRIHRGVPSLFAMSSTLWSQLVQIHITFPDTSVLHYEHIFPSLAKDVITSHQDIVSRIFDLGVILHSIILPGDFQVTTSLLSTQGSKDQYKAVWEDAKREIYSQRSVHDVRTETVTELDLVVADYMKKCSWNCFPESLLLAGGKLARLRMTNCGLKELPMSFGFCLSHLQVVTLQCSLCLHL